MPDHLQSDINNAIRDGANLDQGVARAAQRLMCDVDRARKEYGEDSQQFQCFSKQVIQGLADRNVLPELSIGYAQNNFKQLDRKDEGIITKDDLYSNSQQINNPVENQLNANLIAHYNEIKSVHDSGDFDPTKGKWNPFKSDPDGITPDDLRAGAAIFEHDHAFHVQAKPQQMPEHVDNTIMPPPAPRNDGLGSHTLPQIKGQSDDAFDALERKEQQQQQRHHEQYQPQRVEPCEHPAPQVERVPVPVPVPVPMEVPMQQPQRYEAAPQPQYRPAQPVQYYPYEALPQGNYPNPGYNPPPPGAYPVPVPVPGNYPGAMGNYPSGSSNSSVIHGGPDGITFGHANQQYGMRPGNYPGAGGPYYPSGPYYPQPVPTTPPIVEAPAPNAAQEVIGIINGVSQAAEPWLAWDIAKRHANNGGGYGGYGGNGRRW